MSKTQNPTPSPEGQPDVAEIARQGVLEDIGTLADQAIETGDSFTAPGIHSNGEMQVVYFTDHTTVNSEGRTVLKKSMVNLMVHKYSNVEPRETGFTPTHTVIVDYVERVKGVPQTGMSETFEFFRSPEGKLEVERDFFSAEAGTQPFADVLGSLALQKAMGMDKPSQDELEELHAKLGTALKKKVEEQQREAQEARTAKAGRVKRIVHRLRRSS